MTRTEGEALLLENQLIKSLRPRYNVLLRDDKSYPYVLLTAEQWPRLVPPRPAQRAGAPVRTVSERVGRAQTLGAMHKLFRLRSCEDSVFRNRSRPCLQYQIGRCSAVRRAGGRGRLRRRGASRDAVPGRARTSSTPNSRGEWKRRPASSNSSAPRVLRDMVATLRRIQARQYVDGQAAELDVLAVAMRGSTACVLLLSSATGAISARRVLPAHQRARRTRMRVLSAFVSQYYAEQPPPRESCSTATSTTAGLIEQALVGAPGAASQVKSSVRGERAGYLDLARRNAAMRATARLDSQAAQARAHGIVAELLGLEVPPQRIECFDISHTMGEATVASCVVFGPDGPDPRPVPALQHRRHRPRRRFRDAPGARAMHQATERRGFRRGGGRRRVAGPVADRRRRGPGGAGERGARRPGRVRGHGRGRGQGRGQARRDETLLLPDGRELRPGRIRRACNFVQQVRDEAHRFAITGHRGRRQKARVTSRLEDIPGIGPRRRANLLRHFGGLPGSEGGMEEISRVEGVNAALAERIYADAARAGTPGDTDAKA